MTLPSDQQLRKLEAEFKAKRGPDTVSYLARLLPTILRFYLDGYSRQLTYDFLKGQALISCSRTSFYKWLEDNVSLAAEAQAYAEAERKAGQGAGGEEAPRMTEERAPKTQPQASMPAEAQADSARKNKVSSAKTPRETVKSGPSSNEPAPEKPILFAPLLTTLKIESAPATEASEAERERARKLAILDSTLSGIESKDMGAVAERARAKLAERDSSRGKDG